MRTIRPLLPLLLLVACNGPCEDGFARWEGNCYQTSTADRDDGGGGLFGMTPGSYARAFVDRYCEQIEVCSSTLDCPDIEDAVVPAGCDFDRIAASDCLDGAWGCDANGLPNVPRACGEVFTCDDTTRTTASTGR